MAQASFITNADGLAKAWFDEPRFIRTKSTDNGHTAFYASAPSNLLTFPDEIKDDQRVEGDPTNSLTGLTGTWAEMQATVPDDVNTGFSTTDQGLYYWWTGTAWRRFNGDPNEPWATDFGAVPSFVAPSGAVMTANTIAIQAAINYARTGQGSASEKFVPYTVVCPGTPTGSIYFVNGTLNNENVLVKGNGNGLVTNVFGWARSVWIDGTNIPSPGPVMILDRTSGGAIFNYANLEDIGIAGHCVAVKAYNSDGDGDNAGLTLGKNVNLYCDQVAHADNTLLLGIDFFDLRWIGGGGRSSGAPSVILRSGLRNTLPYLIELRDLNWSNGSIRIEHDSTGAGAVADGGSWIIENIVTEGEIDTNPYIDIVMGAGAHARTISHVSVKFIQRADTIAPIGVGSFIRVTGLPGERFTLSDWELDFNGMYHEYIFKLTHATLSNVKVSGDPGTSGFYDPASSDYFMFQTDAATNNNRTIYSDYGSDSAVLPYGTHTGFGFASAQDADTFARTLIGLYGLKLGSGAADWDTNLYRRAANQLKTDDKLLAALGIGVGNSAAGSTPGTVVKKMEVFDASGSSLGFVPIYDAIT